MLQQSLTKFRYGEKYTDKILAEILDDCDHDYISGLSLLGGEPFCNLDITLNLSKHFEHVLEIQRQFGYGLDFYMNI